jgi:hypothetical protein
MAEGGWDHVLSPPNLAGGIVFDGGVPDTGRFEGGQGSVDRVIFGYPLPARNADRIAGRRVVLGRGAARTQKRLISGHRIGAKMLIISRRCPRNFVEHLRGFLSTFGE